MSMYRLRGNWPPDKINEKQSESNKLFFESLCMIMAPLEFEIVLKESNYQITSVKSSIYTVKTKLQRLNPNYLIYMKSCKINVFFKTVHISSSNLLSKTFGISKGKCSYETCIFSDSELRDNIICYKRLFQISVSSTVTLTQSI